VTLLQRILVEKRSLVIPLAIVLLLNVAVYALVVYPLGVKQAGAEDRAAAAATALRAAEQELASARALVAGKGRAEEELATFYDKVLPADLSAARRMTYASLPRLAQKTNVRFADRHTEVDRTVNGKKDTRLGRLQIRMSLSGDYESFRQFLYELETAAEFIIVDDITLAQSDQTKPLTFTVELSAYYRLGTNGI
jgi:hypothetical protein